jgi:hypothetical protein
MYIPAFFSTAPNGCPNGFNGYTLVNYGYTNLNTGPRGKQITNWNEYTNEVRGENYLGSGSYSSAELTNGATVVFNALKPPTGVNITYPNFGSQGNITLNYNVTGSNGQDITYCYDCTRKYRWTFGSKAGLAAPWPEFSNPLTIAVLSSPNGNINSNGAYATTNLDFDYTQTATIEGYGPLWQWEAGGSGNEPAYYIISREDITPTYYYVQNCATSSVTASIALASGISLGIGQVFKSSTSTLSGSCWSVSSSFQTASGFTPTYSNVTTASTYTTCDDCGNTLLPKKYTISTCDSSSSYVVTFTGSYEPATGTTFSTTTIGLENKCLTVSGLAYWTSSVNYSNVTSSVLYTNCSECEAYKLLVTQSLFSYVDVSQTFSYPGSGSTIYDIRGNNDATILSSSYWNYNTSSLATPVLGLNTSSSDSSSIFFPASSFTEYTLLLTWYGENPVYNAFSNDAPLLYDKDQDPGNNQFGMSAINGGTIGVAVFNGPSPINTNVSASANLNTWHVSQISLNNINGTGSYCLDGITGSYTGSAIGGAMSNIVYSIFGNELTSPADTGFTSGSMWQVAAIYTGSLSTTQMLSNYNALKNRYGL